jgi:hypothetical protein
MTKPPERRRRFRSFCLLVVRCRAAGDDWQPASVLDLTESGCRLRVSRQPPASTRMELRFEALLHDGVKSATIEVPARVTWCRPLQGDAAEVGAEFLAPPEGLSEILGALEGR